MQGEKTDGQIYLATLFALRKTSMIAVLNQTWIKK